MLGLGVQLGLEGMLEIRLQVVRVGSRLSICDKNKVGSRWQRVVACGKTMRVGRSCNMSGRGSKVAGQGP